MPTVKECPCASGLRYQACCAPYHRGRQQPPDAVRLMRSRYAAFALKEVDYLWRTLHPEHPDRRRPEADVLRELREAASRFRYTGLEILDVSGLDASGAAQVLFLARMFQAGKEHSFLEASTFHTVSGEWRYVGGATRTLAELSLPVNGLTLRRFLSLVAP